ncbi:SusD/RagB-like outer membrane lipoprotein [Pontibacter ummariensis]|uniref:Susd and RagB outer membrane lipoprotein n=1 Tax=Pontibacter ummariensis TaxID=1610492 RepID=A0A239G1L4_9BACT|nr:SusD/RagB family nutrient-binding outer membrane lipoprotein [Pontibacter ummariensis]PRY11680.1 SusD/RagB-like outer membrane lipoprotein [Pontibacter ummariensis]SNS63049.1 Susd and RagB outer membrane lipoprotein [Pontibacter ummariensis]
MKRIFVYILGATTALTSLTACEDQLEDNFYNPEETTEASIGGFFTEMLDNNRVRPSYWDVRTFVAMQPGVYTQSLSFSNSNTKYQQNPGYTQNRWDDFYRPGGDGGGAMAHFRAIEAAYAKLPEGEKASAEIFVQAAKVIMLDEASEMVDLWGGIPFSEAGSLNLTGTVVRPKFDNAEEVYEAILTGLEEASAYFATAQTSAAFQKQDIMLSGNVDKWRRYTNSLRLRLLMRTSFADEAAAKQEVLAMLNAPGQYPLVDESQFNILLAPLTNYTNTLNSALTEIGSHSAPEYMLENVLKPANDPRIEVLFDKYGRTVNGAFVPNAEFKAMPLSFGTEEQTQKREDFAILDSATFLNNSSLPGIAMTAAEVNFLKAEAYERWGGGEPEQAYRKALEQSVDFYYYLNNISSSSKAKEAAPTAEEMAAFLDNAAVAYTGTQEEKLAKIWTQKWVHFGFLQAVQSWSEYRRTGYPQLTFTPSTLAGYELPPSRLTYPSSEAAYNTNNYETVRASDVRTGKIFWDVK